jgi:hypothetical protein
MDIRIKIFGSEPFPPVSAPYQMLFLEDFSGLGLSKTKTA